jgi:hypothetical protein
LLLFRKERLFGLSRSGLLLVIAIICFFVSFGPYIWVHLTNDGERYDWMRGSSFWGVFCGVVGGWLIAFEMLYWVRRKWRGWPSNYFTRKNLKGWPFGEMGRGPAFTRAFLCFILSPVYAVYGMVTATLAFLLGAPLLRQKHQRQIDGSIPRNARTRFRESLIAKTQDSWLKVKAGLWYPIGAILFLFQIVPLGVVWLGMYLTAGRWVKPIVMFRFGCKTHAELRNLDEKRYAAYKAALADATAKERDKIKRFVFPTQVWLIGHIIFGILSLILIAQHTGYRWGGTLTTWLSAFFYLVILSGFWGLWMQQIRPRQIRDEIEEESIASQVDYVMGQRIPEAERLFQDLTGLSWQHYYWKTEPDMVTAGAHQGDHHHHHEEFEGQPIEAPIRERAARELYSFFQGQIVPYMLDGRNSRSVLRSGDQSARMFLRLRSNLPSPVHTQIDQLELLCNYRRNLDRQESLNWWLHSWLYFHLSLSVAMFALMLVHIFVAFKLVW